MSQVSTEFIPTRIAILTVSNRRGEEDDTSGHYLRDSAQEAGHHVVDKAIVKENRYAIRAQVSAWIASDDVQVVLITGGTAFRARGQALLPAGLPHPVFHVGLFSDGYVSLNIAYASAG